MAIGGAGMRLIKKGEKTMTIKYQYNKKWRKRWPKLWQATKKRYYQKTQNAQNERKRYTKTEEKRILTHKLPDSKLSEIIKRSVEAIQIKRYHLKA